MEKTSLCLRLLGLFFGPFGYFVFQISKNHNMS